MDNKPHISHIPDIYYYDLTKDDKFIVMACDGVWDVLDNTTVVNFVSQQLKNKKKDIAHALASYAITKGSTDNVSVIVIIISNKRI